jgi:hypothetical protein
MDTTILIGESPQPYHLGKSAGHGYSRKVLTNGLIVGSMGGMDMEAESAVVVLVVGQEDVEVEHVIAVVVVVVVEVAAVEVVVVGDVVVVSR